MKNKITIAGLSATINFCNKLNNDPVKSIYISQEPLATIYGSQKDDTYTVNIIAHIPVNLNKLNETNVNSGLFLNKEKTLFLNYNGVCNIDTSVQKQDGSGVLLCRDFNIEYDSNEPVVDYYDIYQAQFDYKLADKNFQSVEAIIVKLINEDPETDRGTVTAVRTENN